MASPLDLDLGSLPADVRAFVEAERAARQMLEHEVAELSERNARLEHLVQEFQKALHDRKSEKLSADERQLAFEDLETAVAEAEAAKTAASPRPRAPASASARRNLGRLPQELPRLGRVVEPASTLCPCGCGAMTRIGEDRSERLDIVPAQFQVIVTIRPKYACRGCSGVVVQAPAPVHLIESALSTEALIAHVLSVKIWRPHARFTGRAQACPPLGHQSAPGHPSRTGSGKAAFPFPTGWVNSPGPRPLKAFPQAPSSKENNGPGYSNPGPGKKKKRVPLGALPPKTCVVGGGESSGVSHTHNPRGRHRI